MIDAYDCPGHVDPDTLQFTPDPVPSRPSRGGETGGRATRQLPDLGIVSACCVCGRIRAPFSDMAGRAVVRTDREAAALGWLVSHGYCTEPAGGCAAWQRSVWTPVVRGLAPGPSRGEWEEMVAARRRAAETECRR